MNFYNNIIRAARAVGKKHKIRSWECQNFYSQNTQPASIIQTQTEEKPLMLMTADILCLLIFQKKVSTYFFLHLNS